MPEQQFFWKMLPQYMAMGQPQDEYWNGDPKLSTAYRRAYAIQTQTVSRNAWLQGVYNLDAFSTVLANAFGKGGKNEKYFQQPLRLTPLTEQQKRQKEAKEWAKIDRALHLLKAQQQAKKRAANKEK